MLEAFFKNGYDEIKKLFEEGKTLDELLKLIVKYDSVNKFKKAYSAKTGNKITRGALESYLSHLKNISVIKTFMNPGKKTETSIELTYIGIAHILNYILGKSYV